MIKVHKFGPSFGLPDASPFVVKVETYLRMTGQPYETTSGDVRKAPRRQLPVVEIEGKVVPDSGAIVELLESRRAEKLDAHLDARQRSIGVAYRSMLEEHLYFGMLYMRWVTDDGWSVFEPALREMLGRMGVPALLRGMISGQARKQTIERTAKQGMGRRPRSEVVGICREIIDALSVQLGDAPYVLGAKPTTFDATAYAFTLGILCPAFDNEVRKHAASKGNLVAYEKRMTDAYWTGTVA
jgi:glutathione S-transferase